MLSKWLRTGSADGVAWSRIILHLFYNLVWGGERLTSGSRCLPENLPTISNSADLSRKVPNPVNPYGIPVTLYVLYRHRDRIGTFSERSAEFEIGGRFSGRHLDPEVLGR